MGLKKSINELAYRMKLRKELQNSPIETLRITKEETDREINRRNKNGRHGN